MTAEPVIAAIDVGSLANIGWWRLAGGTGGGGCDLDSLVELLEGDLHAGRSLALGFEAPMFIPSPATTAGLNRKRVGERGRPWCAGAGTGALALGLQQARYVLSRLSVLVEPHPQASFDPAGLDEGELTLVIWEAFVSGKAKNRMADDPHVDDARVAVEEFASRRALGQVASDIVESSVLNLAGAALLASGLSRDIELLNQACVVVRVPDLVTPPRTKIQTKISGQGEPTRTD